MNEPIMPLRFCKTRWTENVQVVERVVEMLPQLRQYIKAMQDNKVPDPKTKTFGIVKESCSDVLIEAKLAFYRFVGKKIKPFLTLYQTDKPMMPFLAGDLRDVIKSLMTAVIKAEIVTEAKTAMQLCEIKVSDTTKQLHCKKVDIGFSAEKIVKKALQNKQISELHEKEFRESAKAFIIAILNKLLVKCPLKYFLVRNMSCLDPRLMAKKQDDCKVKMKRILHDLVEAKRICEDDCDDIQRLYEHFLDEVVPDEASSFCDFNPTAERVDRLLYQTMASKPEFSQLWIVVRLLLILSHGQASVERGFSVNRQIEVENRSEDSYVAQRIVCDHIEHVGGLLHVDINSEILRAAGAARMRYQAFLDDKKKMKAAEAKTEKRKLVEAEVQTLTLKKLRLEKDMNALAQSADTVASQAESKSDLTLLAKSNSLRKSSKEKAIERATVEQLLAAKEQELLSA